MATSVVRTRLAATASVLALTIAAPALAQTAPDGGATAVDDIIVTAQKREESIQDVPIAVSAFSAETLDAMKIEGGSELLRAIPNVSFSKSNFSMYNFSIRGIGTKAVSASSDPAVAVSFNNSPLLRNRLFEQEYLDVNRVEVLRGPQGTLYGRNATAGVVNMIPNLPEPDFDAMLKAEVGNYGSVRGQMMVNIPLSDTFWVRGAASMTKRDGFDLNTFNDTQVNGRDLYSTRLSAAWEPSDRFSANLIWEHFGEDDNRSRTGKQLCTRDPGPEEVAGFKIADVYMRGRMSQGCLPGSLYSDEAYSAPNGIGLSQMYLLGGIPAGRDPNNRFLTLWVVNAKTDPYLGVTQSKNLREISTTYNPVYRADNDVIQLNARYNVSDRVTLFSQTLYTSDSFYATQDYARYVSNPIFNDNTNVLATDGRKFVSTISPGGMYDDPQLGLSSRMLSVDLSQSENDQFYQELRLQADVNDRFNFSVGANYLNFNTDDNYYVFNNTFSVLAEYFYNVRIPNPITDTNNCQDGSLKECVYVDKSRLGALVGDGHNYFRSKNVVETTSWAVFGEAYLDVTEDVTATLGLRYTKDEKISTLYPSQLLLGSSDALGYGPASGGSIVRGYVAMPDIVQDWSAVTGRFVLDWRLTDNIMAYASYARGYKGGGTNPPRADINPLVVQYQPLAETFDPEYVNSFEAGVKTDLYDGMLRFNATAFYYDYKDYQVSQIVDRISLNENFDAKSMGLEFETIFRPTRDFRIDLNLGFLKTRIDDGEKSIDVMNRTQGNKDWVVLRPWIQVPSNCIAPAELVAKILSGPFGSFLGTEDTAALCGGSARLGSFDPKVTLGPKLWQRHGFEYDPLSAPNGGRGFDADLSGNDLPNAPHFTANVGAQYTFHIGSWDLTVRGDYYRQSSSYFRVYNTEYDKLRAWDSVNMVASLDNLETGLSAQIYVKNLFDDAPIVDAFTNSDDSMLTTNVFTLDPRLVGFSVTKSF
ncbi:TonB-dependent receptor [Brevundimonas bullata]|uniref:TonB-dependent receptor n=1 Tax=Brevundimonas bullata TaxID=13160 RepID=UPI002FD9680E